MLLLGQAKNKDSPFNVADWSIKEASSDWKEKARARIRRVDQVIVICGKHVDTATGINRGDPCTRKRPRNSRGRIGLSPRKPRLALWLTHNRYPHIPSARTIAARVCVDLRVVERLEIRGGAGIGGVGRGYSWMPTNCI